MAGKKNRPSSETGPHQSCAQRPSWLQGGFRRCFVATFLSGWRGSCWHVFGSATLVDLCLGIHCHVAGYEDVVGSLSLRLFGLAACVEGWRGSEIGKSDADIILVVQDLGKDPTQKIIADLSQA